MRLCGALFVLVAVLLSLSCASGPGVTPATADQARILSEKWTRYREKALRREEAELFYDARVSRNGFHTSATLAVRDDPGRSLSLRAQGPLGLPLAGADWDGESVRLTSEMRGRESVEFGEVIGVPLSAKSLSLLFFGVPEEAPPESFGLWSGGARYSWHGGDLYCDFDLETGRARRIVANSAGRRVEIDYLAWKDDLPSKIRVKISGGGRADLELSSRFSATR